MPSRPEVRAAKRRTGKPAGRPRKAPAAVAEAVAAVERGELAPEDAAAVAGVARSTLFAEMARQRAVEAPGRQPVAKVGVAVPPAQVPPLAPVRDSAPPIPDGKLRDLAALVARLPLRQQDALLAALPLDALRGAAVARGLAGHPTVALAVARELRGVAV